MRPLRGGLGPARLRKVKELVHAKVEDELTLIEMAQSVELSPAHFSRMFRKSTGETPHQFVLRQKVERAKEMLCEAEMRVLDVALACGFKTQQHSAGVPPDLRNQPHRISPGVSFFPSFPWQIMTICQARTQCLSHSSGNSTVSPAMRAFAPFTRQLFGGAEIHAGNASA